MIVASAPLRISFNGGGSDLPAYFRKNSGLVVSMPLDKRVFVTVHASFQEHYRVAYNRIEIVSEISQIQHPIVRGCLEWLEWQGPAIEITSVADVPSSGTGLGSSSAFTVALLTALTKFKNIEVSQRDLAYMACKVEVDLLNSSIGYQDQYVSALGGLNKYVFRTDGVVEVCPVMNDTELKVFVRRLKSKLMFFHLDFPRQANLILEKQIKLIKTDFRASDIIGEMVGLASETAEAIKRQDFPLIGNLMRQGWILKSQLNGDFKNPTIEKLLEWSIGAPIHGAKLLGAGGGGFLAVIAERQFQNQIRRDLDFLKEFKMNVDIRGPSVHKVS